MKPAGALTKQEAHDHTGVLYYVYSTGDYEERGKLKSLPREVLVEWTWPGQWFNGEYGYFFDNYFHALAYSLKLKAQDEANRRKDHSTTANP